ncbi:Uncharacterized protein M6B38_112720 [Iris pallida]|uniref:DUF4378 domain-containing protein n=1 Tax=Iris pallida TaxID=29817 RepID=A0AAX6DN19_IRIPA|nr:Uncharacterized protein M6B38_112720 [Iris pallida]
MAKKSRKQHVRPKKDNAGCMSGLISMFDFRQGRYTRRLLSDKKFGSRQRGGIYSRNKFDVLSDLDENRKDAIDADAVGRVNLSKAGSIKALMEEEMSGSHTSMNISSSEIKMIKSETVFEANIERNQKQTSKKLSSDHGANELLASQPNPSASSTFDVNLAELLVRFCSENNKYQEKTVEVGEFLSEPDLQSSLKQSILQKALSDFAEVLLDQKTVKTKLSIGDEESQSREFIDALDMLNSNKELFLKLLEDPNPLPMKHILALQNGQIGEHSHRSEHEEQVSRSLSNKQNGHHFFKKKDKSKEAKASNESSHSQGLNRIIVLKPSPGSNQQPLSTTPSPSHNSQGHQEKERVSSHFSLKEIKRRLRNMIGESKKERHLITMDGVLHKIPYGFQNSGDNARSYCSPEHASQVSKLFKKGDKKANAKEHQPKTRWENTTIANPLYREPDFYSEAQKHLVEMVTAGEENEVLPTNHASIPLGRILQLPEYNFLSPRLSPRREKVKNSPENIRCSTVRKLKCEPSSNDSSLRQSLEYPLSEGVNPVDETESHDSNPSHIGEGLIQTQAGSNEIEECENVDMPLEYSNVPSSSSEGCKEEGSCLLSELEPYKEPQPTTLCTFLSPNSITVQKLDPGDNIENRDRPSPVSVLEPFLVDSITSPEKITIEHAELIESRQLHFDESDTPLQGQASVASEANLGTCNDEKETKLLYVKIVLEASGLLNHKQFAERWQSSDQLLDPFVYDKVEISFGRKMDDSRLLFDCVNEVLVEIHERYLSCTPWASFIRPSIRPIPTGVNFLQEVSERFDQHLCLPSSFTLDQVVRKDLDGKTWMNHQLEAESTIAEIGELFVDYIMEETILELWD